jgi:hypothetical protein
VEDVVEAASWYEAHAPGLGEQLIDEILAATRPQALNNLSRSSLGEGGSTLACQAGASAKASQPQSADASAFQ